MVKNILFDCDPGADDSIAILETFAHPEKVHVLGMTTVGGNQVLENVTNNLQHLLWFLKQQTPIAPGQSKPIIKNLENASDIHGSNGLAGPTFPSEADNYPVASDNGITFLHQKLAASTDKITILATAPLTNIALLLRVFPKDAEKIERIIIMGGTRSEGNITPDAEFNFYVDPDAADIVLTSGVQITLCGLDVTNNTALTPSEIDSLKGKGPASQLAYEILVPYFEAEKKMDHANIAAIHDLATISYLLEPDIYSGKPLPLKVNTTWGAKRGKVELDSTRTNRNVLVLDQVDRHKVVDLLVSSLNILDKQLR